MKSLLPNVIKVWNDDRNKIIQISRQAVENLKQMDASAPPLEEFDNEPVERARRQFHEDYDEVHGGFAFAPKFP